MLIHLGVPMRNIEHRLSSPNVSFPPMQSFRKAKDEPAFAGSKHLQMFAFSLVHERSELFELTSTRGDHIVSRVLGRLTAGS